MTSRLRLLIAHHALRSRAVSVSTLLLAAALSLVTGCLSKPSVRRQYFYLSPITTTNGSSAKAPVAESVSLRSVIVSAPFAGRSLVYRLSETSYEVDPYAEFLVSPERMLGESTREWWRHAGTFKEVLEPEHRQGAAHIAELHVTELYGDFRSSEEPTAAVTLRLTLRPSPSSNSNSNSNPSSTAEKGPAIATLHRQSSRRIKLREKTAAAVAEGMQQALGEALSELSDSLTAKKAGQ